ncbi:hypothetical protein HD554DRAFT_548327 [Boletus coccyginus]|nr:hypothetical protein HD554DRAFT_548327 [Boletus coccyginus]
MQDTEVERIITTSQTPISRRPSLYDRLNELPVPWFAGSRTKPSCIAFQLPPLSEAYRTRSGRLNRGDTFTFGAVTIKTRQDLSRTDSLYFVHPRLDALWSGMIHAAKLWGKTSRHHCHRTRTMKIPPTRKSTTTPYLVELEPASPRSRAYRSNGRGDASTTARCASYFRALLVTLASTAPTTGGRASITGRSRRIA